MENLCFIISSIGGPKILSPLLSKNLRMDTIYMVYQRMPSDAFMKALVECIGEDVQRQIIYLKEDSQLVPGGIYFFSSEFQYRFEKDWIRVSPAQQQENYQESHLDSILISAGNSPYRSAVVVLSGMFIDRDGIGGIRYLKETGAKVYGTPQHETPVYDMIDDLQRESLLDELQPSSTIMSQVEFGIHVVPGNTTDKVLIVDDEEDVREIVGDILGLENISCDYATDGLNAISKIQRNKYSAIVMDMKMPELDGLKTLTALTTMEPNLPILIITGYDDSQTHDAAKSQNVIGVLLKPFTGEDIKKYLPQLAPSQAREHSTL